MAINEFRVALTTKDFNRAVIFYRDGIGLDPGDFWTDNGQGQIFWADRAGLEIFDQDYAKGIDRIEVGNRVSGQIRFAFEVPDIHIAMARAINYGATLVHEPVLTPWKDMNVRVLSPEGLQVTLFQVKKE